MVVRSSISKIALLFLLLLHGACMIIITEMTSRVISFIPWSDPHLEGLHLIAIPYLFIPVSLLAVSVLLALGHRGPSFLMMLGLSALMLFPTLLLPDHDMQIVWLTLAFLSSLLTVHLVIHIIRHSVMSM